ncbi:hypothetical protein [Streptomyces sp. NRRL F-5122]|nr:hypothetical protein [Streptomyces sp. NRRL F-5122]
MRRGLFLMARVDGDPVRLRQIVTSQFVNALKFVLTGGTGTLTLRQDKG